MSTINAVNTRLVTVAASHVHRLAHGCLLPAEEGGFALQRTQPGQFEHIWSQFNWGLPPVQHSALPVYSFTQNAIERGERIRTKMGVREDFKKWQCKALSNGGHPVTPGFTACLNKTQHQGAPNRASRTSLTSSCFSYLSMQLDISASITHL